jgi:sensor histidine kinase regulating citrate/malate metabolism
MPRKVRNQIFKRSFSTKGEDRGLGTYSILLLTERYLGGTVAFTSKVEDGTRFWIDIPA